MKKNLAKIREGRWKEANVAKKRKPKSRPVTAGKRARPASKMRVEHAIDAILDHMRALQVGERLSLITRILAPLDFIAIPSLEPMPKPRTRKAERVKGRAEGALAWKTLGNESLDGVERHGYEALTAMGSYSIHPASALPSGKFIGYSVAFRPTGAEPGQARRIKDGVRTAEQAKAIAQRDHDGHFGA
jgi:hypothetical protein